MRTIMLVVSIFSASCAQGDVAELRQSAMRMTTANDPAMCEYNAALPLLCETTMCEGFTDPCVTMPQEWFDGDCDGFFNDRTPTGPVDNCLRVCNPNQQNSDTDHRGDVCDPCPFDPADDIDKDGICGDTDNCPAHHNPQQEDADTDGFGDPCDQSEPPPIS